MEEFLDLISKTADGVIAVDREHRILLQNEAAEELLGFTANDVLGRSCYEVIGGQDGSGHGICRRGCLDMVMALRQEVVPTHDIQLHTKAGREVWMSVSTILVPSRQKDPCVLVHLFRDVTSQKELERFVQQLRASLAKLPVSNGTNQAMNPSSPAPSSQGTNPAMSPSSPDPSMDLSRREQEVLHLLASGASTKAIATKLCISPSTARNHIYSILSKLGVHCRLEAVTLFLRNGLA